MFVKEKFEIRHKILIGLRRQTIPYDYSDQIPFPSDIQVSLVELSKIIEVPENKILEQIDYLIMLKEVDVEWVQHQSLYMLLQLGYVSLYDNKYIDAGKKVRFTAIKEFVTLVSIIIATLITLFTFFSNYIETKKNALNIEEIKKELIEIKSQKNRH